MPKVTIEVSTGVTEFAHVDTMPNPDRCPICRSTSVLTYWPHGTWHRLFLDECINCGAAFLVDGSGDRI